MDKTECFQDSIEKYANNLIYVLKHKNVFTEMKLAARKTALRYNEKIVATNVLSCYRNLQKEYEAERWIYFHLKQNYQAILIKEN